MTEHLTDDGADGVHLASTFLVERAGFRVFVALGFDPSLLSEGYDPLVFGFGGWDHSAAVTTTIVALHYRESGLHPAPSTPGPIH